MSRSKSADKPTPELIEELYDEQVQRKNLTPATHPNVVFVTGVAGSGKTHNTKNVKEDPVFNVFSIHPDDYRKRHPKIKQFIKTHGRDNAHEYTGSFSNRTALALRDKAIENRLNVLYEATFGNIETAKNLINSFAEKYYRVAVIALPVDLALSIARNEERYQIKKEDIHTLPRKVSLEHIQKMADNFVNNLNELENSGVIVYRISNHQNALQAVTDIVLSMQKLDKAYKLFAEKLVTLSDTDRQNVLIYEKDLKTILANGDLTQDQQDMVMANFYNNAADKIQNGQSLLPKAVGLENITLTSDNRQQGDEPEMDR